MGASKGKGQKMTYDYYFVELFKAKQVLEGLANQAEANGFKVSLQFNRDMDDRRHQGKPHSINITLAKEMR